ncbi:MAG: protein translocase subunit SecD [Armatimonadetes bacterium]|nr:protein translocase subunit SecD [Armatimonadota bacterium]
MQPRPKVWIPTIIAIFVVSFLLGFAPIRRATHGGFEVNSNFAFQFAQPLVSSHSEISAKEDQIRKLLKDKGLELVNVEITEEGLLQVETAALDQEQADSDHEKVLAALKEEFGEVTDATALGEEETEKPIAEWGPFAIYPPRPQLKLGLDLQGGAHVVLRCLPSSEMTFTSPEDKPLVKSASGEEAEGIAEGYQPPYTADELKQAIINLLQRQGVDPKTVRVTIAGTRRLVVETQPRDKKEAQRQNNAIADYLRQNYPGVEIEVGEPQSVFVEQDTADKVQYIIEQRLYSLGEIREPLIQKQGEDRIIVEMPGVKDPQRVLQILKSTAMLEFRLIPARYKPISAVEGDYSEWKDEQTGQNVSWEQVRAESEVVFTGRDLLPNSRVQAGQTGDWVVAFELRADKKDDFHEFTRRNIGRIMAIVLDRECKMAPNIRSAIPGAGIIEGNMTAQEAGDLKLLLNAGALPVPLEVVENRTVSATLGQDSIVKSLRAAFYGVVAVMAFMIFYYRLPGLLADLALLLYMALVIAVTAYFGAELTLPGIAGVILSLGTAVDANVIIFERLKEELWSRKSMRAAVAAGFDRAWTAILDANVTTLIATAVLYWLGTSLIKGFAVMLFIGIVCSLFTAVTVTRWLLTMVCEAPWAQKLSLYGLPDPDKVENRPAE